MLTFNEEKHEYKWNGRVVPSVTGILEPLFDWSRVPKGVLNRKAAIGSAVHAAIHLELAGGGVDMASLHPACFGYFEAWQRFRDECTFDPVLVEYRICSDELGERYRYAGTLDEWGLLQSNQGLIDWKCCMQLQFDAVGSQTAAYLKALHREGIASLSDRRFALKLGPDGRYKLERFRMLADDWQRFVGLLRDNVLGQEVAA